MLILHFSLQHTATHVYLAASMGGLVRVCVREILDGFFFANCSNGDWNSSGQQGEEGIKEKPLKV